jgi:hypothetical protein
MTGQELNKRSWLLFFGCKGNMSRLSFDESAEALIKVSGLLTLTKMIEEIDDVNSRS